MRFILGKILIYGEYSGLGKSISAGFNKIGYQCDVFSFTGDGFKEIKSKFNLSGSNKFIKFIKFIMFIPRFLSYNTIFIMNPTFLRLQFLGPILLLLFKIKGIKLFLIAAGDDVEYIKTGKMGLLGEWPYCDVSLPSKNHFSKPIDIIIHYLTCKSVSAVIPFAPDYKISWDRSKYGGKVGPLIPFPCDGEMLDRSPHSGKIKISHGINRVEFKGSNIIKIALERIKNEYPDQVEVEFPNRMIFSDYINHLKSVDICIDQTKGNGYGMNALYALLSGCVVLAPTRENFNQIMGFQFCPVISISNNVESIYNQLKRVINSGEIDKIRMQSQEHVGKYHSPEIVANKIVSEYMK